jgi:hypothetical protein
VPQFVAHIGNALPSALSQPEIKGLPLACGELVAGLGEEVLAHLLHEHTDRRVIQDLLDYLSWQGGAPQILSEA